jgi:hypothetical protein
MFFIIFVDYLSKKKKGMSSVDLITAILKFCNVQ